MESIDITVDLETCSLSVNAAVMSIGAIAWNRDVNKEMVIEEFEAKIDLRSSFIEGFDFDRSTAKWWSEQSEEAKAALLSTNDNRLCTVEEAVKNLCQWITDVKEENNAEEVYLWSQGTDFDIAILRNICRKYDITLPVKYSNFRDHRTFNSEMKRLFREYYDEVYQKGKITNIENERKPFYIDEGQTKGVEHDALSDCKYSILITRSLIAQFLDSE